MMRERLILPRPLTNPTTTNLTFTKQTITAKPGKKSSAELPNDAFTRVVREDPNRRGFLYAGTETGMYFSSNDGENWQSLRLNLPVVPITDLAIHKREERFSCCHTRSFVLCFGQFADLLYQMADAQRSDAFSVQTRRHLPHARFRRFSTSARLRHSAQIRQTAQSSIII